MSLFNRLLMKKAEPSFHASLKHYVLEYFKTSLHQHIQPQMGGFIDEQSIGISILNSCIERDSIQVKSSIFYIELIGGCNCNDGPHEENGYFEQFIKISESGIDFLPQTIIAD